MERNWNMEERTDGKRYSSNDMVKAGCHDCLGCSACCHNMGNSIVLDPWDVYQLTTGLGQSMEELLAQAIELNVVDGLVLPNLKMQQQSEACFYLDENGRCRIHAYRPGICRLFPLGRIYENGTFQYFLQVHECKAEQKTKVKIKQWIGIPDIRTYEAFVLGWHTMLKEYQQQAKQGLLQGESLKQQALKLLQLFYIMPYRKEVDFYSQYEERKLRL